MNSTASAVRGSIARASVPTLVPTWGIMLLAIASLLDPRPLAAQQALVVGADGQVSWEGSVSGGDVEATEPEFRSLADPNITEVGTSPSGLVEFDDPEYPGWILPVRVAEGQNVAPGLLGRGGSVQAPTVLNVTDLQNLLQGMIQAATTGNALQRDESRARGTLISLDLGARFGVNRIRFFPRNTVFPAPQTPFQGLFLRNFEVHVNDGINLTEAGNPIYEIYEDRRNNTQAVTDVLVDPPRYIRFVRVKATSAIPFEIEKIQVFGEGFVPTVRYLSPIIKMGARANWGRLRLTEEVIGDSGASGLQIRTRTGNDPTPFSYTRRQVGLAGAAEIPFSVSDPDQPLGREEYLDLPLRGGPEDAWERGSVREDLINWSPWSAPYDADEATTDLGTPVLSPSPRQFLQVRADFSSGELESARALSHLSLGFVSPPLADSLVAEVFPREAEASTDVAFVYAVRAELASAGLQGFDGFQVSTRQRVQRVERIEILDAAGAKVLDHTFAVQDRPTQEGEVEILEMSDQGFTVRFPRIRDRGTVVKIHFVGRVLAFSTTFAGRALVVDEEGFQDVRPGNAASLGAGDSPYRSGVTVLSPSVTGGGLIRSLAVGSSVVTPNGDGHNDRLEVSYEVVAVVGRARMRVEVLDLAGRRVRRVFDRTGENGTYDVDDYPELAWDGTAGDGQAVTAGLYLLRVEVEGDAQSSTAVRTVVVAY